jgi:putative mRNA 3-end processing factor
MTAMPTMPAVDVEYLQGIHLVDSILWLDASRRADLCFLSCAKTDPIGPHTKLLLSEGTAGLVSGRTGTSKVLVSPFHRRFSLGGLDLELAPSGHMLGAAQIRITRKGKRLVYTGDFRLEKTRTAEQGVVLDTDILVMKATYGLAHQQFPPRGELERAILDWSRTAIENDHLPVFFTSPLGKAQELAHLLGSGGLKVLAHRSIYQACKDYNRLHVDLPGVRRLGGNPEKGTVILFPWHLRQSRTLARLGRIRTAMTSGRALEANAGSTWNVDAAFALSGRADRSELMQYITQSRAKKIYLVGRNADEYACELRKEGHDAWPLKPPQQLDLLGSTGAKRPADRCRRPRGRAYNGTED